MKHITYLLWKKPRGESGSLARTAVYFFLLALALVSYVAMSASTPPSIPAVALSADPLYAVSADKPALALALSVEFPTVGALHRGTTDYLNTTEFMGYFDTESCYNYVDSPTETPGSGETLADYKRFQRAGAASSRMCNTGDAPDGFSGNFLNWALSSSIDMLRMALTGGDRSVDIPTLTILQRAYLPDNQYENGCFFNNGYFPAKRLLRTVSEGLPNYYGAVPSGMQTAAGSNNIWIGNMLNRVYFRASSTAPPANNCTDFSGSTLSATYSWVGSITDQGSGSAQPSGWTATASANRGSKLTTLPGVQEVLYGYNGRWKSAPVAGTVICNETTFSGGSSNSSAKCYVRTDTTGQKPPTSASTLSSDPFFYARVKVCDTSNTGILQDTRTFGTRNNTSYGLCTAYTDGGSPPKVNYKPTGVIQAYSEQLRLAAFGYLIGSGVQSSSTYSGKWGFGVGSAVASGSSQYGGVLRAPMKYVGAKTFNEVGVDNTVAGGNPGQEWNASTGVFAANPDNNTSINDINGNKISGVINYLNRFGRTGNYGRYKNYDPVGEMYGEALRYLQGLQPTGNAISNVAENEDGYPVYTTWSDPYGGTRTAAADYSCNRSNILVVGDVNSWDSNRLFTRAADLSNNLPDFYSWSVVVKNLEAKASGSYTDNYGTTQSTAKNPTTANTRAQSGANGQVGPLMAQAYWAHTHDIRGSGWTAGSGASLQRPGLKTKTFLFDVNENSSSCDTNSDPTCATKAGYRRTQNQYFTASKYGGFETDPTSAAANVVAGKSTALTYNTKGNPFYQDDMTTADTYIWQDTDARVTRQGEANTYFLMSNARSVLSAFEDIFNRASLMSGNIAGGAIQSKSLTQAGDTIYQGRFNPSDWTGDLWAIPVTVNSANVASVATIGKDGSGTAWTASSRLAALSSPATSRNIFIGNSGGSASPVAVDFQWSNLSAGLQAALDKASPGGSADGLGSDRVNYLRGDATKEGNPFRLRNSILGDIVNSGVIYSGAPSPSISDAGYSTFYSDNKDRTQAIFVGANDGMLHAFVGKAGLTDTNKQLGDELFAYIPSWIGPKLSVLTSANYVNSHQSFVDGTPTVGEAYLPGLQSAATSGWRSVLVGSTGGGGQGVFALDVTKPASFSASNVLWEFTDADDVDLGNVVGRPQILKFRTSNSGSTTYKYFAVFGSGVNNYINDGAFSTTGSPALFLLDLDKSPGTAWELGVNYYKISIPISSALSATDPTGLINFRATVGLTGEVSKIFMGDLHGNFWKLDFSQFETTDWNIYKLSSFDKGTTTSAIPLYIAKDADGYVQPISAAPMIAYGPMPGSFYVAFGTGKYLEVYDKSSTRSQSVYMIYDTGDADVDSTPVSLATAAVSSRGRLQAGAVNASTGVVSVSAVSYGRATSDSDTVRSGWYFDFPSGSGHSGERVVSNPTVFGNQFIFGSLVPSSTGSTSTCSGTVGAGFQYTIDYTSGNGSLTASTVGIMGEPLVAQLTDTTAYSASDSTGRRIKTTKAQIFSQGSAGVGIPPAGGTVTQTQPSGRLSWRQISNYYDLKNKN